MPLLTKVIDHLLNQTYKEFEIIVVDDASSDNSVDYLNSVQDPRLKIFSDGKLGRGKALNFGLSKCSGKYVAVNDADDLSLPDRLRQQVEFLEANPDYGLVGSNFIKSFSESEQEYTNKSLDNDSLRTELSLHSCIQHSAVLFENRLWIRLVDIT
jgi:glycosyltransferase involved in cell wall biosynthesis